MNDRDIDWKRHDERYLSTVLGHYAVFERPDRKPENRSPMQRVMRQIKELRGQRYWSHIVDSGGHLPLSPIMHESWFQLPAEQKEEHLLRYVDWTGVSEKTRDKVIAWQLRSRDGEISAHDEWHLHDQLMRVEATTPNWSELSSTSKLETLLGSKDVDWRPFPPEFQAIALGHMIRREVKPTKEGFEIVGIFEAKAEYPHFGRYIRSSGRGGYEQSLDKGPKQPVFSKATARNAFRWAVAKPRWEAFVKEHGNGERAAFREQIRPLWREFWEAAKKLNREELSELTLEWSSMTTKSLEQQVQQPPSSGKLAAGPSHPWPSEIAKANRLKQAEPDQGKSNGNEKAKGHDTGHSM